VATVATTARFLIQNPPISICSDLGPVRVDYDVRFLNGASISYAVSGKHYRIILNKRELFLDVFCWGRASIKIFITK